MESYKNIKTNIYSAPFYGFIPDFEIKVLNKNFKNKFTNKDYLIVSNQFWAHKDHITAIKAVELLNKTLDKKVNLICTGFMYDYRATITLIIFIGMLKIIFLKKKLYLQTF